MSEQTGPVAAHVAEYVDPLRYVDGADPAQVISDLALMAAVGARLTYAIYYGGKDWVQSMPLPVMRAYATACGVFDVAGHAARRPRSEPQVSTAPTMT